MVAPGLPKYVIAKQASGLGGGGLGGLGGGLGGGGIGGGGGGIRGGGEGGGLGGGELGGGLGGGVGGLGGSAVVTIIRSYTAHVLAVGASSPSKQKGIAPDPTLGFSPYAES